MANTAQAYHIDPFNLMWGSSADVNMVVKPSESCRFGLKIGNANHVESVVISQAPQHGTVSQEGRSDFHYHARSGYTGPDAVRITATGDVMSNRYASSGEMNVTYEIHVVP